MTWIQLHERMAFMADLIDRAAENPDAALNFNGNLPDVERLFGSEEDLFLSLQQRWMTALTARLGDDSSVEQARAELAASEPGLRILLDAAARRSARVRFQQRHEQTVA
jgi:ATP adenylyltransferase